LLDKEGDALTFQPYPGELGKRIYENISQEGWQRWLTHQTMLINEHRLSPINPEHRKYLESEMEKFFFGEGSDAPEGYVPPEE
jgi:Fe-S cluster biosynthesis and repair protein YggX